MKRIKNAFTFIEQIIANLVLVIIAVLSFSNLLAKQKLNFDIRSLASAFMHSRNQAAFLRKNVNINFANGFNAGTPFYCLGNQHNTVTLLSAWSGPTFKREGALASATVDFEFKLDNSKRGMTKNLILAKSGSIFYQADGVC